MGRRVVVTGLGCVCPVGNTARDSWEALLQGRSGVATISQFDASGFPVRIAAEVKEFAGDFTAILARFPKSGRNVRFGVAAGAQAVEDAGLLEARYTRSLMKALDVPVLNQFGLRPAVVEGTKEIAPLTINRELDKLGLLNGVT